MSPARGELLAALPGWTWDAVESQWESGYQHLLAFLAREGHLDVPAHYWDEDGFPLGSWVRSHRRPGGGRRTITAQQQERLEALPGWTYDLANDVFWEKAAVAFETFVHREGHCRTPRHHREDGINIDAWSKQQRARFHRGELDTDRARRLEAIRGWSWSPQQDAWERGFAVLKAHVRETGTAAVARDVVCDDYPLGAWVGEQRNRHARRSLEPRRQARLEALPGWSWDRHGDSWERHFNALLGFVAREGHARVPTDHVEVDLPLASWVIRHRQDYKAGTVPAERVERLEALPGWTWDVLAARWEEHYFALCRFADREGHARVPDGHMETGLRLGRWVITQRQGHRKGDLSSDRTTRLAAVDGWAWDMRDVAWETGFQALQRYQGRTGHCRVPSSWLEDGYRLGQWLQVQRGLVRAGQLRDDRTVRLTALLGADADPLGPPPAG